MNLVYAALIPFLWIAWCIYWWSQSRAVKQSVRVESAASRAGHIVPLVVAVALLFFDHLPDGFLEQRILPATRTTFFVGAALTALGLGFTIAARRALGRNWSGLVTLKQGHELVRNGPYRYVRHPIYTGLLLAFVGSGVARGEWRSVLAVAIVFVALWRKLQLEERWMVETFGDAYRRYRAEVKALIPFVL